MLFVQFLLPVLISAIITVPRPDGPYGVSITDVQLNDTDRIDPYTNATQRKIPISIIAPTGPATDCEMVQQPYLPYITASVYEIGLQAAYGIPSNNTLTQLQLSLCKAKPSDQQYPLILFSPGYGAVRQFYNIISSNIAAQGFIVVTVDTPGQASFIAFPDGTIQPGVNTTDAASVIAAVNTKTQDLSFILDQLSSNSSNLNSNPGLNTNYSRAAIYGHSIGGTTSFNLITTDTRFIGGANLDGDFYGPLLNATTDLPYLLFAGDNPDDPTSQATTPGWATVWSHLYGPKWQLRLNGSRHNTFTDYPVLASLFGWYQLPGAAQLLGTTPSQDVLKSQVSVLSTLAGVIFGQRKVGDVLDTVKGLTYVDVVNATNSGQ